MSRPDGRSRAEKVKAVQRFLGFVNYLTKFVPHLADESEQLRRLTDKDAEWVWERPSRCLRPYQETSCKPSSSMLL